MCGIVFVNDIPGSNVVPEVISRYLHQRSRGTEGFGFSYMTPAGKIKTVHETDEAEALVALARIKSNMVLFHHRRPTSTANVKNACHPFPVRTYGGRTFISVHNGVVWNDKELAADHEKAGINYISKQEDGKFNDSEALAVDMAMVLAGKKKNLDAEGSIAIMTLEIDDNRNPKHLYVARNASSPLEYIVNHTRITIASTLSEASSSFIATNKLMSYSFTNGQVLGLEETDFTVPAFRSTYVPGKPPASTRALAVHQHNYDKYDRGFYHGGHGTYLDKDRDLAESFLAQSDAENLSVASADLTVKEVIASRTADVDEVWEIVDNMESLTVSQLFQISSIFQNIYANLVKTGSILDKGTELSLAIANFYTSLPPVIEAKGVRMKLGWHSYLEYKRMASKHKRDLGLTPSQEETMVAVTKAIEESA